jgi:hypothetical protein
MKKIWIFSALAVAAFGSYAIYRHINKSKATKEAKENRKLIFV